MLIPQRGESASAALPARFEAHLRGSRLIEPGATVLVALSGGLDSVVLLDLLLGLPVSWRLNVRAAHYDHAMRPDSAADAAWVAGLCLERAVPLHAERADAALTGEAEARRRRYAFLRRVARACDARVIATAHQADDQAETVLFRMLRGTGLRGLRGIPARRGRVVRPLLPFRRAALAAHARNRGLEHREDPTNADTRYARNWIRHALLPALEDRAPDVRARLRRVASLAGRLEATWEPVLQQAERTVVLRRSDRVVELARAPLLGYHAGVRARLLRRVLRRLGSVPDRAGTRAALAFISSGASGHAIHLAGGLALEREFDILRIRPRTERAAVERALTVDGPEPGAGTASIGGRCLRAKWRVASGEVAQATAHVTLNLSAVRFPLELRAWRPGDRIALPYGTKKLKKLFGERRVGRQERGRAPVLADCEGRVLWVAGIARAAHVAPRTGEPVFRLTVTDA